jgi:alpha-tubulin suppressor-like RCC1 family protein
MSDVETVSCGKDYTLVLSKIGHVYAFGLNTM